MSVRINGVDLFDRLQTEFENLFGDLLVPGDTGTRTGRSSPAVNLWEDDGNLYVECEIPGVRKDQLEITVVGKKLSISGERSRSEYEEHERLRSERSDGSFSRVINLPQEIDPGAVSAKLENGILRMTLPKVESAKPRKIRIG